MMRKEYLDVLDENGNKTGKVKLRYEIHRDGDFHKTVHIWVINKDNEVLLQRRCATKDIYPNMLDISCAGHLVEGDSSLRGAIRELKEELDMDVHANDLTYIQTVKIEDIVSPTFIDNEFYDLYIMTTDKEIHDMEYQKSEISEIMFVPYVKLKEMIKNNQKDLVVSDKDFEALSNILDGKSK